MKSEDERTSLNIKNKSHFSIRRNYLFCMYVYAWSLSRVRLFATLWTLVCQALLSMGILQARILECVFMSSSKGSSQPRDQTQVSHIAGGFLTIWATWKT